MEDAEYVNKTPIDKYIDNYWMMNCPDNHSASQNDQAMAKLISKLLQAQPAESENIRTTAVSNLSQHQESVFKPKGQKMMKSRSSRILGRENFSPAPKRLLVRNRSMSEIARVKKLYGVKGLTYDPKASIKELGIGAQIDQPQDIRKKRDVTHKIRDYSKGKTSASGTIKITREDLLVTPESILKHQ